MSNSFEKSNVVPQEVQRAEDVLAKYALFRKNDRVTFDDGSQVKPVTGTLISVVVGKGITLRLADGSTTLLTPQLLSRGDLKISTTA